MASDRNLDKDWSRQKGWSRQKDWPRQQELFGRALLDPLRDVPEFVVKTTGKPSIKRFNIYRNNVMVSLTEAILDTYPVVSELVGNEFATAMARVYVGDNLPKSPVLLDYGEGYAAFIDTFEPAQSLPFLADMARLEWAWLRSYHSVDETPLKIEALNGVAQNELTRTRFGLCQSVQLLRSDYPIASIWSAHQGGDTVGEELGKIVPQEECVLVNRPQWEVDMRILTPGTHAFFASLQTGHPLGISIDKGSGFSSFDPASAINALFETSAVAALMPAAPEKRQ